MTAATYFFNPPGDDPLPDNTQDPFDHRVDGHARRIQKTASALATRGEAARVDIAPIPLRYL